MFLMGVFYIGFSLIFEPLMSSFYEFCMISVITNVRLYVCNQFFSGYIHQFFLQFCRALEIWKRKKVTVVDFLEKSLFAQKWAQNVVFLSFHNIFYLLFAGSNLSERPYNFLFTSTNLISEKTLLHKFQAKILSPNQIAGFYDHQYFWKKMSEYPYFLH